VGIMPLLLLATEVFRRYASAAYRETQGRYAAIQAFLQEQLSGLALVQMNAREVQSRRLFRDFNQKYLDAFLRTIFAYAVFFPVVEFITNGTLAALIFYAGFKLKLGTLTLGLLLAFIQQSGRFFRPIRELAERYNVMQTALASSERIFKLLDDTDQIPEPAEPEPVAFEHEIRLEGVGFAYEAGGRQVVRGLSGVIPKGRRVAVVGHTGAGKSTLINLLMRFYDVAEGRITVDGLDLRGARLKDVRALFGLVLQDVFIFSGTLEENITLGRPLDPQRLDEVLRQSQLDDMVGRLADGLRTQVGERGQKLSAGERQLVAFARMLYQEPAILLLDEATANIDSETEHKIQKVIERVSHRLTTFTIAHRLSTIKDADEIWVMDQGQLVERPKAGSMVRCTCRPSIPSPIPALRCRWRPRSARSVTPVSPWCSSAASRWTRRPSGGSWPRPWPGRRPGAAGPPSASTTAPTWRCWPRRRGWRPGACTWARATCPPAWPGSCPGSKGCTWAAPPTVPGNGTSPTPPATTPASARSGPPPARPTTPSRSAWRACGPAARPCGRGAWRPWRSAA
jgi:ABC-type transport system involved in cytochrome bd biosynthesis fused ATPase/permease subunit